MPPLPNLGHFEEVRALAANARLLALGGTRASTSSRVTVFDHAANKPVASVEIPAHASGLAFAGDLLLCAGSDGALRGIDPTAGSVTFGIAAHPGGCHAVTVSPDRTQAFTVGADGTAARWTLPAGKRSGEWKLSAQPLRAVAVDPAGEYFAAAGDDGVVRVVTLATGAVREMPGHQGAVLALAFTPRDGRLVSAGEDSTLRIWYTVGAVEFETRGGDDAGHTRPVHALLTLGVGEGREDGEREGGDRVVSAGGDGVLKVWPLETRRKPRTLQSGGKPQYALALIPPPSSGPGKKSLGVLLSSGADRYVRRRPVDAEGNVAEDSQDYPHGFQQFSHTLQAAPAAREAALRTLAELDEREALGTLQDLADQLAAQGAPGPDQAALAIQLLGERARRPARPWLRERLDAPNAHVRASALTALRRIDGETSLSPLRAALESQHPDLRVRALRALVTLADSSPLVPGLIASALTDADPGVRLAALDAYEGLFPTKSPEPLRTAYERGPADVKTEVIVRAALAGLTGSHELGPLLARAFDDADESVRRTAFVARVLERPALAARLREKDEGFERARAGFGLQAAHTLRRRAGKTAEGRQPDASEVEAALAAIPARGAAKDTLTEQDLEPLLTALSCRTPDTAVRGARALAAVGDTRALGALLQLTREGDAALRRDAAQALQELSDPRARKRLVWMFDDSEATVRAAALDAFARLEGRADLDVAESALRASHEDIRVRGLDRLVKAGSGNARAEELLGDALEDESPKVRAEAFRTLWAWHTGDPEKALDRALSARFADLRLRAVQELAALEKAPWSLERIEKAVGDANADVARAAYDAAVKRRGKEDPTPHLLAVQSVHPAVRAAGARGAVHTPPESVRSALMKLLPDEDPDARLAALESLDRLLPNEAGPLYAALQGSHLDLRVRAAELLAARRDEQLIEPMRALLADKDLFRTIPLPVLRPLRARAAEALATLGSPRTLKYFATELLKDEYDEVKEQAARGMANAARRGDEAYLLEALGHKDVWVRSWAADGLARLGDPRALPVLTGNLRHEHLPIRAASILSFAALGPEGFGGLLQGLEDKDRGVQETVLAIVLARDLRAFRKGDSPELLTTALSSQGPDVRFAAARALELRADPEAYLAHLIEVLSPPKPEKAAEMKDWPAEEVRGRILVGLAEALGGELPEQRYAATMALALRRKPREYFREAERAGKLRSLNAPWVGDNTPRAAAESDAKPAKGWLRRLFSGDAKGREGEKEKPAAEFPRVPDAEQAQLKRLAFGAYVGLLRQVTAGDEEGHRVRRDAIDRVVDLGLQGGLGAAAAVPPVSRALDDPNHLVRRAAFAGLKKLFPAGSDEPLALALASASPDVARAALDELAAAGEKARPRIAAALDAELLDVRRYAFELLERLSPKGSLEPLIAALGSQHADLRLEVIERLASSNDPRVTSALTRALSSDHDDLRLRAATLLAERRDDRGVDVLAGFLRSDDEETRRAACASLGNLATGAAVRALATRLEESEEDQRPELLDALGETKNPEAIDAVSARLDDESAETRGVAMIAAKQLFAPALDMDTDGNEKEWKKKFRPEPFAHAMRAAVASRAPDVRAWAAGLMARGGGDESNALLRQLFQDRDGTVRAAAVTAYGKRVVDKNAPVEPLEAVVRAGTRELLLPAAEAVAHGHNPLALRPLLLVLRAGEPPEQQRAVLALGTLGDARALAEIETVAAGGTAEAPVSPGLAVDAVEALGRIYNRLEDPEARQRVLDKLENAAADTGNREAQRAAARGLRWVGGERARVKLEALLADHRVSYTVREEAARQLGELGDRASETALARALNDSGADEALGALEKLFPEDRVRVALHAVSSEYEHISSPAATYLTNEGDPAALIPRLGALTDAALRQRLRFGLLRRAALPTGAVAALLAHDKPFAREEAAWLAVAAGEAKTAAEKDRAALGAALLAAEAKAAANWATTPGGSSGGDEDEDDARSAEARAWERALWAIARLGVREGAERARKALGAGESGAPVRVRREAARVLGALAAQGRSEKADANALAGALTDADAGVRAAAAAALRRAAGERATSTALEVRPFDPVSLGAALDATDAGPAVLASDEGRRLALPALLARGDGKTLADAFGRTKDPAGQLDLIAALGRAGGAEAAALLQTLAFDKKNQSTDVRKAAYRALRRARRQDARKARHEART